LTTGLAPVTARDLNEIRKASISCINFLTDDPWNSDHRAPWFFRALKNYDAVFSPRYANLDDLQKDGCRAVHYLPFAYSPENHLREISAESCGVSADILFAGGADSDRLPYVRALVSAGIK